MDAKNRLDQVRLMLEQRGVRDVKFFLAKGASDNSCADVATKVADFLEGYIKGSFVKVDSFNDQPQKV
jgi:hypothetical protein